MLTTVVLLALISASITRCYGDDFSATLLNTVVDDNLAKFRQLFPHIGETVDVAGLFLDEYFSPADATLLHLAAKFNSHRIAQFLIENGGNMSVISTFFDGKTPIQMGVSYGNSRVTLKMLSFAMPKHLLEKDANLHQNIFHIFASSKAKEPIFKGILQYFDNFISNQTVLYQALNEKDDLGQSPLHVAVVSNNALAVSLIIKATASCFAFNQDGLSPLHLAAKIRNLSALKALLLSKRCDPEQRDACGLSFYDYASKTEILRKFVENASKQRPGKKSFDQSFTPSYCKKNVEALLKSCQDDLKLLRAKQQFSEFGDENFLRVGKKSIDYGVVWGSGLGDPTYEELPSTTPYTEYPIVDIEVFNESSLENFEDFENSTEFNSSRCDNGEEFDRLKKTARALKYKIDNLTRTIDAERQSWNSERDYIAINAQRHMNSVKLIEMAIRFTKILKIINEPQLSSIDLHNLVQVPQPNLSGSKQPPPPISKFVFSIYGKDLTSVDAGRICRQFGGASLANIRSLFEVGMLELPNEVLDSGVWIGLVHGPVIVTNISITSFWWSDGSPLIVLPEDLAGRHFTGKLVEFRNETLEMSKKIGHESVSTVAWAQAGAKCGRVVNAANTHLERFECEDKLGAALCELPLAIPWYTFANVRHNSQPRFTWLTAGISCSSKYGLMESDRIHFRDDDIHLNSMIDPLVSHLAVLKLPYMVSEALEVLRDAKVIGKPCWVGLTKVKRSHESLPDELRWIDGSLLINSTSSKLYSWFKSQQIVEGDQCVALSIRSSTSVRSGVSFHLLPCSTPLECALCQTSIPNA